MRVEFRFETGLPDSDHVTDRDEIFDLRRVPVRGANATVTSSAPDRLRIIRAVNPDAGFVQAHPENANRIVGTWRQIE